MRTRSVVCQTLSLLPPSFPLPSLPPSWLLRPQLQRPNTAQFTCQLPPGPKRTQTQTPHTLVRPNYHFGCCWHIITICTFSLKRACERASLIVWGLWEGISRKRCGNLVNWLIGRSCPTAMLLLAAFLCTCAFMSALANTRL